MRALNRLKCRTEVTKFQKSQRQSEREKGNEKKPSDELILVDYNMRNNNSVHLNVYYIILVILTEKSEPVTFDYKQVQITSSCG